MLGITPKDPDDALDTALEILKSEGQWSDSRAGRVLSLPTPFITVWKPEASRVSLSAARDANPFFHIAEAVWMLAGDNMAGPLNKYVKDFGDRFAEADGTLFGAYGYRWRKHFDQDQLLDVVSKLRENHEDRRVVITMWDPEMDLSGKAKDHPCNTHVYPRVVNNRLDITVCCRSNDAIWGAYGANVVHFTAMQHFISSCLGIQPGVYYQISNNFHVYEDTLRNYVWNKWCVEEKGRPTETYEPKFFYNKIESGAGTLLARIEDRHFRRDSGEMVEPLLEIHRDLSTAWNLKKLSFLEVENPTVWHEAAYRWGKRRNWKE